MTQVLDYQQSLGTPTRARFGVLAFLCTLALLLYVDRVCIGVAAPSIQAELGLSKTQMSLIFNAFTLAYCLFEVPTGHWGDRYGSRGVIARIATWWSLFTALSGAAFGFWSLLAIRFLFGAGEAGAFPNTARVITRWFPPVSRGMARGAVTFVSMIGAAISPVVASYLISIVGWRYTFVIFGAAGVAWAIAFFAWFRDSPAEHRSANAAERTLIGVDDAHREFTHVPIPWSTVLSHRTPWLLGAIMGVNSILFYTLFQWYPTYLKEAHGQAMISSGWLSGSLMIGAAIGCIAGGFLADAVLRHARRRSLVQRLCGSGALFSSAASVVLARFMPTVESATFCYASAMFFIQLAIPTWWAAVAQISGRHGASMWGLMNSMGGLALMGVTFLVGWFVEHTQTSGRPALEAWQWVFDGVAVALGIGGVCWLAVHSTRSIVET